MPRTLWIDLSMDYAKHLYISFGNGLQQYHRISSYENFNWNDIKWQFCEAGSICDD